MSTYDVCTPTFKKPFGTTFKPRTISSVIVPVMPLVWCLSYINMKQSWSHKKMQNEAALLMLISLYSVKIMSGEIFEIYQDITEVVMTQFVIQLLWFPAQLRCSIRVTMLLLDNNVWYFIFSNHYLAFFSYSRSGDYEKKINEKCLIGICTPIW